MRDAEGRATGKYARCCDLQVGASGLVRPSLADSRVDFVDTSRSDHVVFYNELDRKGHLWFHCNHWGCAGCFDEIKRHCLTAGFVPLDLVT